MSKPAFSTAHGASFWLVLVLALLSVSLVVYLSGKPAGTAQALPVKAPDKAELLALDKDIAASPNLTRVDAFAFVDPVPAGKPAPDFTAKDALGRTVKLSSFRGKKNVVLIFYQGSFCLVCGHQMDNLQRHWKDFQNQEAHILAISADSRAGAQKTLEQHRLSFTVIADPEKDIIRSYGVGNVSKGGIAWPSAFVVDKKGVLRLSYAQASGKRIHSDELLPALAKLTGKPAPKLGYEN